MPQSTRFASRPTPLHLRRHRLALASFGVLAPLALFAWLAARVVAQEAFPIDDRLLAFMHAQATPARDFVMLLLSRSVSAPWVVSFAVLSTALLWSLRRRRDGAFWVLALGGAALMNLGAKQLFGRIRPDLFASIAPETTYSFPSGHAMQSMAILAALLVLGWRTSWRWAALAAGGLFVAAVGLSRIYLGVHYPTDVLAGWSLALAWVIGLRAAFELAWTDRASSAPRRPWHARR
jgi:membrane-associated phospholipid phosphatase